MSLPMTVHAEEAPTARRFVSLRARLLAIVLLVLVAWLALVMFTQADERKVAIANVGDDALALVHIITSNQAAQVEAARQLLLALARLPQLRKSDPAACSALMADLLKAYPLYLNIGLVEPDGNIACSALPMRTPVNVADRLYFQLAVQTRGFGVGDYQQGRVTGLPSINYAYPLLNAAGNVEAVIYIAQNLDWLTVALAGLQLPSGAVLAVTDRNGTVLARVPPAEGAVGRRLSEPALVAALAGHKERGLVETEDVGGIGRLWAYAPLIAGTDFHAMIGVSKSVAFADIDRRLARNLFAFGLVTALALAAAWFGASRILRQVDALVAATRRVASGDLDARTPSMESRNEIELLAGSFNRMAETLQARDRALRLAEERTRAAEVELAVTKAHIDIARKIQRSLLPDDPLILAGVRLAGRCIPAAEVGGDYFGYFLHGRSRIDSLIGDVSGYGVGAALMMAAARTTFMNARLVEESAAVILAKLNVLLHDDLDRAQLFMTASCMTFDAVTNELHYANAGHPPALVLRAGTSRCIPLGANGVFLGIQKDARFDEVKMRLDAGDIVVFYTDGITEMCNEGGEFFGVRGLEEAIVQNVHAEPEALIDAVLTALERFAAGRPYDDDCTIVAMKVTG
ncbi:MAG: SpoIIE family protein phosphatase [Casimicrobiaceae bacterium]